MGIPVSNSLLTTWLVMAVLIILALKVSSGIKLIPGYLQSIMEAIIGGIHDLFEEILHENNAKFFPFLMTLFLFIIFNNWSGLLPGVGTIGIYEEEEVHAGIIRSASASEVILAEEDKNAGESAVSREVKAQTDWFDEKSNEDQKIFVPLLRSGSADLNTTLALAILTMGYIQFAGLSALKMNYVKKFINISNPINFVVGILELVSEFARIISFSFRLFGNIFAGEVLLTVIAFLMPLLAPIPFLGLELFVGFIQALVFPLLAAVFFSLAVSKEGH